MSCLICPNLQQYFLLEHYGLLTGRVQLFHNKYTQSTHTSIPHEYVKHIRTHRDKTFGFGTAYLGQYFPAKDCPEASSWIFLNAFKFLRCGPFPKFGAHGARATPSWPHRSTGETVGCFSKAKPTILDANVATIGGLLLGNHVNLEGGMRKSARRNKGASLTTVTFDPTRCQTLFCCHAESFSCLGWMWLEIWEERYWVYGWFHHVPSQHRLWIARITLCSAAWFFETGPDLRIFHAGETHNKTIQNPWLLLVRFSTTVCCDVISKQVPRKQHTHTHREKAQQASHEKSARAQVLCPSQDFFVGKVSEGCNMLWVQQTNNYVQYVQHYMLWQVRDFTNLL